MASFIITARCVSGDRKKLPLIPWTDGGTPVTIETLFGFVNVGIAASTLRTRPARTIDARNGAASPSTAASTYSLDEPSKQTTIVGRWGIRYSRPLTWTKVHTLSAYLRPFVPLVVSRSGESRLAPLGR